MAGKERLGECLPPQVTGRNLVIAASLPPMYCPRCGHENARGSHFCSNCGSNLPREGEERRERRSRRERIESLAGTTRAARLATAGTLVAIAVAIVAFLALNTNSEADRDQYTLTADAQCVDAKRQLAGAAQQHLAGGSPDALTSYAEAIVSIVARWRADFETLDPGEHTAEAARLNDALIQVLIQAGALARVARESGRQQAIAQAGRVDSASAEVESAIRALDLDECARLKIGTPANGS